MRSNKELSFDSIQETQESIDIGTYGKVFKVGYFGAVCIAKEFPRKLYTDSTSQNGVKDHILNKSQRLTQLRHPNVVQCLGIYFKPDPSQMRPVMVMEKMDSNLGCLLETHPNIHNSIKLSILLDVSLGLRYLHGQKPAVVHCNLTSDNILLTSQLQAKIGDVGMPQMMGSGKQSLRSKKIGHYSAFMAPEVRTETVTELTPHPSADIFSYGAVVLHTITQQWPESLADDALSVEAQSDIERHRSQINMIGAKIELLKSLVLACLDNDPSKRPPIVQVSETIRKTSEKLPFVNKSPITWQAEVEQAVTQVKLVP